MRRESGSIARVGSLSAMVEDGESITSDNLWVPSFIVKLWAMLHDPSAEDFIRWTDSGDSIAISNWDQFSRIFLSK